MGDIEGNVSLTALLALWVFHYISAAETNSGGQALARAKGLSSAKGPQRAVFSAAFMLLWPRAPIVEIQPAGSRAPGQPRYTSAQSPLSAYLCPGNFTLTLY